MTATTASDDSEGVEMVINAGEGGASVALACPYIPALEAVDEASGISASSCSHSSADVVHEITTGTPKIYAAVVWVPPQVTDVTNFAGKGNPTLALFTTTNVPIGDMVACTLPSSQRSICDASLRFFLDDESNVAAEVGPSNLSRMDSALAAFLSTY